MTSAGADDPPPQDSKQLDASKRTMRNSARFLRLIKQDIERQKPSKRDEFFNQQANPVGL